MTHHLSYLARWAIGAVALTAATVSCRSSTAAQPSRTVAFQVRGNAAAFATAASSGPLAITSVRIVVDGAALGSGDQYGCVDCQGNNGELAATPAQVISVPLDGGTALVTTERVSVGTYRQIEISLDVPSAALVAANPGWPANATIMVTGSYNGTSFTLPLAIAGSFRQSLSPPLNVAANATSGALAVHLTLPIASWFTWNGAPLNPADATQRAQIEANARAAFQSTDVAESSATER